MDLNELEKGDNYTELKDSYVIFICTFDPFNKNLCCYSFANLCMENYDLPLGDGRNILFFNTKGSRDNVPREISEFLEYVETGVAQGAFIVQLDSAVKKARRNREWKVEYMKEMIVLMDARREGREEGLREGCEQGRISMLHSLVNDGTLSIETAADKAGMSVEEFLDKAKELT